MNAIPWYRSNVLRALLVGGAAFALKQFGVADQFPDVEGYVDKGLDLVQVLAGIWAAWARIRSPAEPVTLTKAGAEAASPKLSMFTALLALLIVVPLLQGCDTFAVMRAQTNEQRAAALLGDFNLYQKASLQIGSDASVVPEVRKAVLDAAIAAKPAADSLDDSLRKYRSLKRQLAAGTTTEEKVAIAAGNLQEWVRELLPLVTQLRQLTEGAQK
jgi:hypothetical protein